MLLINSEEERDQRKLEGTRTSLRIIYLLRGLSRFLKDEKNTSLQDEAGPDI